MGKRASRTRSQSRATTAAGPAVAPSMAAYDGANTTGLSPLDWLPAVASADADLLPDLQTRTARSRDLNRNNGVMAGGMQTLRDNIVGSTLRLSTTPDYRLLGKTLEWALEWGNNTEAKFRSWADTTGCGPVAQSAGPRCSSLVAPCSTVTRWRCHCSCSGRAPSGERV